MTDEDYYRTKLAMLREHILPASSVLIVSHDYPDPDCLAAAVGMQHLISHWGVPTVQITFGGFVGRAENRAMIRLLGIDVIPIMLIDTTRFDRVIVVDSFPGNGHVSLPSGQKIDVVLDHHPNQPNAETKFYYDIRTDLGATSTLVTRYLLTAGVPITPKLATALFYGIKTDTNEISRNVSIEDLDCYKHLFELIDHRLLSQIESPARDQEYYRVLNHATQDLVLFDAPEVGYTHLGKIATPDSVAEIADLCASMEGLSTMVASGIFKNQIFYSIRVKNGRNAGGIAMGIAQALNGYGGGHATMAAGRIPLKDSGLSVDEAVVKFGEVFRRVLEIENEPFEYILQKED